MSQSIARAQVGTRMSGNAIYNATVQAALADPRWRIEVLVTAALD